MESHQRRFSSSPLKIALIGYGKMGKIIERMAMENGDEVIAKINSQNTHDWLSTEISQADVCIDFSNPNCVIDNIQRTFELGKPLVVGTTGWDTQLEPIKNLVHRTSGSLLYSPNFSVGGMIFLKILSQLASLFNHFPDYDVGVIENHHNKKLDYPSGTAKTMGQILLENLTRKKRLIYHPEDSAEDAIQISSLRCGSMAGTHSVFFDSPFDHITLTHSSKNREGLATGALLAAHWLQGKKGFFTFEDLLEAFFNEK